MRADRLVSLVLLLQARGRMSARALAAELEVSVRTIYRDISALNASGVPVAAEAGPNGGCWLVEGYRFPLRGLSADETEALLTLGVPAALAELGLADALAAAHRKVRVTAGAGGGRAGAGDPAFVHLDMPRWFHGAEPVPQLRTLAEAVRQRRLLMLTCRRDADGQERTREVGPLGLVNKAGIWYLVAARQDSEPVVYRASRITAARVLGRSFSRPAGFDLAAFWQRWSDSFVTSRPKIEVRVRASPNALGALPYVFGDAGRQVAATAGTPDEEGFREITLTFEDERAAAQRLAGFGGELEVLSPAALRERLVAAACGLLARYRVADGVPGVSAGQS